MIAEENRIRIIWREGYCPDDEISDLIFSSDILLLPFRKGVDSKRSSFITALSYGVPVITTKGANTPSEIIDGEHVLFAPPQRPDILAQKILFLKKHPERMKRLAAAAKTAVQNYSWDKIMEVIYTAYGL